jgi:hypothetical protein
MGLDAGQPFEMRGRPMQEVTAVAVFILMGLVAFQLVTARRFRARGLAEAARLHNSPRVRDLEASLPQIIVDFAHRSGAGRGGDEAKDLRIARFHQKGEIRLRPGGDFSRFSAWQIVALGRAGFLWAASVALRRIPAVMVRDSYVQGTGHLEARLLGSIPVADAKGADISLAEAFRYLAELPWAPDAILGNPDLEWRVLARNIVEVRLATPDGTARASFRFDAFGDIVGMEAKDRPVRDNGKGPRYHEWRARYFDYAKIGPRRIPLRAEAGYVYPTGYEVYFKGRIVDYSVSA